MNEDSTLMTVRDQISVLSHLFKAKSDEDLSARQTDCSFWDGLAAICENINETLSDFEEKLNEEKGERTNGINTENH